MPQLINEQDRAVASALFRRVDWLFLGVLGFTWVTAAYWAIFGQPTALGLGVILLASMVWLQVWGIFILFRIGHLALMVRADINLMPEAAAQMAVQHMSGLAKPSARPAPGAKS